MTRAIVQIEAQTLVIPAFHLKSCRRKLRRRTASWKDKTGEQSYEDLLLVWSAYVRSQVVECHMWPRLRMDAIDYVCWYGVDRRVDRFLFPLGKSIIETTTTSDNTLHPETCLSCLMRQFIPNVSLLFSWFTCPSTYEYWQRMLDMSLVRLASSAYMLYLQGH